MCYLFVYTLNKLLDLSDLFYVHIHVDFDFYQMAPISTLAKRFVSYRCILHHCIFTKLSCFNMQNISYVVLRRHRFLSNLYLKSKNGSLRLERGIFKILLGCISLTPYRTMFEKQYVCIILPVHILFHQADLLLLFYALPCCSVQWTVF